MVLSHWRFPLEQFSPEHSSCGSFRLDLPSRTFPCNYASLNYSRPGSWTVWRVFWVRWQNQSSEMMHEDCLNTVAEALKSVIAAVESRVSTWKEEICPQERIFRRVYNHGGICYEGKWLGWEKISSGEYWLSLISFILHLLSPFPLHLPSNSL